MEPHSYRYKAFISYRHLEPDMTVAKRLHTAIENYRVPAAVRRAAGIKRPGRVFRDQEELPLSPNLGEDIDRALADSEWLVVVCSPRLPQSHWCMTEIDTFIRQGRRDRILTVLVEGKPEESIPAQLHFEEKDGKTVPALPTADLRADAAGSLRKKLKTEKLRLLAPMLGTAFEELHRRAKERLLRLAAAALAGVAVLASGFTAYAVNRRDLLSAQRNETLRSQSLYLAEYAGQVLETGDAMLAKLLALEALPADLAEPDRPLTAEAELALRRTLLWDGSMTETGYRLVDTVYAGGEIRAFGGSDTTLMVYSEGYDNFVAQYDIRTGERIYANPDNQLLIDKTLVDADFYHTTAVLFHPDRVDVPQSGRSVPITTAGTRWSVADGELQYVAYAADGSEALVQSQTDGLTVQTLEGMTGVNDAVCYGLFLVGGAAGDGYTSLRIYDFWPHELVMEYPIVDEHGHTKTIYGVDITEDAYAILAVTDDAVLFFNRYNSQPAWQLENTAADGRTTQALFTNSNDPLAAVLMDGSVTLYNYITGKEQLKLDAGSADISSIQFNAAGDRLLCGCTDSCGRIYNTATGELEQELPAAGPITAATYASHKLRYNENNYNDNYILLQGEDFISIYSLADSVTGQAGDAQFGVRIPQLGISAAAFSADGSTLWVTQGQGTGTTVKDDRLALTTGGVLRVYDSETGVQLAEMKSEGGELAPIGDSYFACIERIHNTYNEPEDVPAIITVYDQKTMEQVSSFSPTYPYAERTAGGSKVEKRYFTPANLVASPNGSKLMLGASDSTNTKSHYAAVFMYDPVTGQLLWKRTIYDAHNDIRDVPGNMSWVEIEHHWLSDEEVLLRYRGYLSSYMEVRDAATGEVLNSWLVTASSASGLLFDYSADMRLTGIEDDDMYHIADTRTGQVLASLSLLDTEAFNFFEFYASADFSKILFGFDTCYQLWEWESGTVTEYHRNTDVTELLFELGIQATHSWLFGAEQVIFDESGYLRDADTGELLVPLGAGTSSILARSADGTRLVLENTAEDGTVRIIPAMDLAEAMEITRAQLAGRTLTDEERERFFITDAD